MTLIEGRVRDKRAVEINMEKARQNYSPDAANLGCLGNGCIPDIKSPKPAYPRSLHAGNGNSLDYQK